MNSKIRDYRINIELWLRRNRPVTIFIPTVNICPTLQEDGSDSKGGEFTDRIATHTRGVPIHCQM